MGLSYYRCCWHEISSPLFLMYRQRSSTRKDFYTPKGFFNHATSLHQPFGHCGRFSTAAFRRSQGSVSVPVWRVVLSHPLLIKALVGHYPTNKLIRHRLLPKRKSFTLCSYEQRDHQVLAPISRSYSCLGGRLPMRYSPVCHSPPLYLL